METTVDATRPDAAAGAEAPRERRPRRERRPLETVEVPAGQARLWINLGKTDGLDEAGLKGALETAGAPSGKLLRTDLRGTYSYAFVADEDVAGFEATSGRAHGAKAIKIERAKQ